VSIDARRLVLGDQLSCDLASLADLDPLRGRVLLAEVAEEAGHVPHHPQKSPSCSARFTGTS
jgi:deoxyribodipyrimidine photolyase-related protein